MFRFSNDKVTLDKRGNIDVTTSCSLPNEFRRDIKFKEPYEKEKREIPEVNKQIKGTSDIDITKNQSMKFFYESHRNKDLLQNPLLPKSKCSVLTQPFGALQDQGWYILEESRILSSYLDNRSLCKLSESCKMLRNIRSQISSILLPGRRLGSFGMESKLMKAIPACPSLVNLDISSNHISDRGCEILFAALKGSPCRQLEFLNLMFNNITPHGMRNICMVLPSLLLLKTLNLAYNPFGDKGLDMLLRVLPECSSLETLLIGDTNITSEGMESFSLLLEKLDDTSESTYLGEEIYNHPYDNNDINYVNNMSSNIDSDEERSINSSGYLSSSLSSTSTSSSPCGDIDMGTEISRNTLGPDPISVESCSNRNNQQNGIHLQNDNCIDKVSRRRTKYSSLQRLDLGSNPHINAIGVTFLANYLPSARLLHSLNLRFINMGPQGMASFAPILPEIENLLYLDISYNNLGREGCQIFAKYALPYCKKLTYLEISQNEIGIHGGISLSKELPNCPNLEYLSLRYNKISDSGAESLSKALLKGCPKISIIDMGQNDIGPGGGRNLVNICRKRVLEGKPLIKLFDLEYNPIGSTVFHELSKLKKVYQAILDDSTFWKRLNDSKGMKTPPPLCHKDKESKSSFQKYSHNKNIEEEDDTVSSTTLSKEKKTTTKERRIRYTLLQGQSTMKEQRQNEQEQQQDEDKDEGDGLFFSFDPSTFPPLSPSINSTTITPPMHSPSLPNPTVFDNPSQISPSLDLALDLNALTSRASISSTTSMLETAKFEVHPSSYFEEYECYRGNTNLLSTSNNMTIEQPHTYNKIQIMNPNNQCISKWDISSQRSPSAFTSLGLSRTYSL